MVYILSRLRVRRPTESQDISLFQERCSNIKLDASLSSIVASLILAGNVFSQPPDTLWTQTFGGSSYDWGSSVQQTADGGYIIAGETSSFGAGSYDVYLIRLESDAIPVEPPDLESGNTPTNYCLHKAYPNPFNASTVIRFDLPRAGWVKLDVYGIAGRNVGAFGETPLQPLVNGYREAGLHEVTFDGSGLPSGVYIYRLRAGQYTASGKMVLMK